MFVSKPGAISSLKDRLLSMATWIYIQSFTCSWWESYIGWAMRRLTIRLRNTTYVGQWTEKGKFNERDSEAAAFYQQKSGLSRWVQTYLQNPQSNESCKEKNISRSRSKKHSSIEIGFVHTKQLMQALLLPWRNTVNSIGPSNRVWLGCELSCVLTFQWF